MKLRCSCNKPINIVVENGIITYKHEDGSLCKILNNFYKDKVALFAFQKIIRAAENKKGNAKARAMIFNEFYVDDITINAFMVDYMYKAEAQELKDLFDFIFLNPHIRNQYVERLKSLISAKFGWSGTNNIKLYDKHYVTNKHGPNALKMKDLSQFNRIINGVPDTKASIVEDLAKSFMIDGMIKSNQLTKALKGISK